MKKFLPVLLKPPFFLISFFIFLFSLATFSFFFSSPSNPFLDQASAQYECTWIGCGDCDVECGGGTMWCWDDCGRDWPEGCNDDPCPPAACGDGSCNEPVESCPADCPAGGETCGQIGTCADGSPVYNICSPCCSCDPQICYNTSCGVPWDCRTQGCPDPNPRCAIAGCGTVKCGDDGSCYSDCGGCEAPPPPPPPPTPIPSPPPPIPTPTPEPINYCAIQQRNPPQTESPIIFYNLYDSYTQQETGQFPECRDVTVTWNWGGDIVLNNEDLSQMSFSRSVVDYLEGRFQDQDHRQDNLFSLSSADFNQYTGRVVKLAPYLLTDGQRVNYVNAVLNTLPRLWEADFTYLDIYGQGPAKTISDLVAEYGLPNPPTASSSEAEKQAWQATWGRYWQKIPLSTNDQSQGTLSAPYINQVSYPDQTSATCGFQTLTVPDNYRLTNVSAYLNQILLPKEAQFMTQGSFLGANISQKKVASNCSLPSYQINAAQENQAPKEDLHLVANKAPEVLGESSPAPNLLAAVTRPSQTEPPAAASEQMTSCNLERPDSQEGAGNKICFNNWPGTTVVKTFTQTQNVCFPENYCEDCDPDDPLTPEDESQNCRDVLCPITIPVTFDHQEEIGFKTLLPYLENIWNKTTYSQEGKSGFFAFFTPSFGGEVLVSKDDYSRHAATPVLLRFIDTTDDRVGTFTPQANEQLFPNYMAGVENSKNFVQNALWPTMGAQTLCLTNQPCAGNPSQTYNTFCTPSCSNPTRLCWDSGNCGPVVDCTLNGWDDYCRTLQGGGCGPYPTCNVEPDCQEGGNCVTQCSC